MQRIEDVIRKAASALNAVAGALNQGDEIARPADQLGRPPVTFRGMKLVGRAIQHELRLLFGSG